MILTYVYYGHQIRRPLAKACVDSAELLERKEKEEKSLIKLEIAVLSCNIFNYNMNFKK